MSIAIRNLKELTRSKTHRDALEIILKGLNAADPMRSVERSIKYNDKGILIGGKYLQKVNAVHVVGFGKASIGMAKGAFNALGDLIHGGVVIAPKPTSITNIGPITVLEGNHPIPDKDTEKSSRKLIEYLSDQVSPDDGVLILISGGGSALFEVPANDLSIEDVAAVTKLLLKSGANIKETNTVRKHISSVKGGQLIKYIKSNWVASLIISDVVGDPLEFIASGPTVPDTTTFKDAYEVLIRRDLWNKIPISVKSYIEKGLQGKAPETPKPGDPIFSKVINVLVASNRISLEAMAQESINKGFKSLILTPYLEGESREVGKVLASIALSVRRDGYPLKPPLAILAGGETTVTVTGKGIGGRNQELCLSLALNLCDIDFVAICMGSDGIDGISPAAGAIVDGDVCKEASQIGIDITQALINNDSYTVFSRLKRAIITGYTGTNVNDLLVILIK